MCCHTSLETLETKLFELTTATLNFRVTTINAMLANQQGLWQKAHWPQCEALRWNILTFWGRVNNSCTLDLAKTDGKIHAACYQKVLDNNLNSSAQRNAHGRHLEFPVRQWSKTQGRVIPAVAAAEKCQGYGTVVSLHPWYKWTLWGRSLQPVVPAHSHSILMGLREPFPRCPGHFTTWGNKVLIHRDHKWLQGILLFSCSVLDMALDAF